MLITVSIDQLTDQLLTKLTITDTLDDAPDHNLLVIEAVPERLRLKQEIFKHLK